MTTSAARWARTWLIEITVFAGLALLYGTFSLWRHARVLSNSYDLGIFVQGVRGWAEGTGPISAVKGEGFNLMGDHFSPIMMLLAPGWWIWPSAQMLLVAQALLLALGAVPLVWWARQALGRWQAWLIGGIYGFSFGIIAAVAFDFHEVAFAVPLVSLAVVLFCRERYRGALIAAAPLVLVKEDLGITVVAALGVMLLLRRRWLLGAIAVVGGVGASFLAVRVFIPSVNPRGEYPYTGMLTGSPTSMLGSLLAGADVKLVTVTMTLAVSVFLVTRSPLLLLVAANLGPRFLSHREADWTADFHYNAVLMAIVVAALIDGLIRFDTTSSRSLPLHRWALATAFGFALATLATGPVPGLVAPSSWRNTDAAASLHRAANLIPDDAVVVGSNHLVPQLAERTEAYLLTPGRVAAVDPDWVIADRGEKWPQPAEETEALLHEAEARGYIVAYEDEHALALRRR